MSLFMTKWIRSRRRRRVPCGLLVATMSAVLLVLVLTAAVGTFTVSASAKIGIGMPRAGDGTVTDSDGIIDSDGPMSDVPDVTDLIPDGTGSDTADSTERGTEVLPNGGTVTTERTDGTTNAVEDAADGMGINPWLLGVILLAVVVAVILLIIRWAAGPRRR